MYSDFFSFLSFTNLGFLWSFRITPFPYDIEHDLHSYVCSKQGDHQVAEIYNVATAKWLRYFHANKSAV